MANRRHKTRKLAKKAISRPEIANDEVEIAETSGKPGAGSKPITNR